MHETQMYLTMFDVLGLFMLSILVSILLLYFVLIATQQRQGANRVHVCNKIKYIKEFGRSTEKTMASWLANCRRLDDNSPETRRRLAGDSPETRRRLAGNSPVTRR